MNEKITERVVLENLDVILKVFKEKMNWSIIESDGLDILKERSDVLKEII